MYSRSSDIAKHIQQLTEVLENMSSDFAHVFQMFAIDINEEDLLDVYFKLTEGPTVFEKILIKEGRTTVEECKRNYLSQKLFNAIAEMLDGESTSETSTEKKDAHFDLDLLP